METGLIPIIQESVIKKGSEFRIYSDPNDPEASGALFSITEMT